MKHYLVNIVKVFAYYMLLFVLCRLVFLVYFFNEVTATGSSNFFKSAWYALPLDISMASYLTVTPLLLLFAAHLSGTKVAILILKTYLVITSVLIVVLSIGEIGVYREMHIKVYFGLLFHLSHPEELLSWVSTPLLITGFSLIGILIFLSVWLLNRLLPAQSFVAFKGIAQRILLFAVLLAGCGLAVIGARGGLQPIPINEGEVYFSQAQIINDATVNPLWNIVHSYIENRKIKHGNVYRVMDDEQARHIVDALYQTTTGSTVSILTTPRPNVCFLILEGWSAELIESLNGYKGLTPNFENLVKDGYLFTHIKSSGHISDQGISAVLSGYPALPFGSVINQAEKGKAIPCISKQLNAEGYTSSFFYGGQLIYGGLKSYIYHGGFEKVFEQKSFPRNIPAGRLGIHDSIMLAIWADSLLHMRQPFFSALFTVTTHSPFDAPFPKVIDWGDKENSYLNSVVWADKQIGKFFTEAKKQAWYNNTVFVLVSDHSHNVPKAYRYDTPEHYHIPLLITGGALKPEFRGVKNDRTGSQIDVVSTVLNQLQLNDSAFVWSKNLLNTGTADFAFYTFNDGFGYVEKGGSVIWNKKYPHFSTNTAADSTRQKNLHRKGEAMLQLLIDDFLKR